MSDNTPTLPADWPAIWAQRQHLAQLVKHVSFFGIAFPRKAYGTHEHDLPERCNDCGIGRGQLHVVGCCNERCAVCGTQAIGCGHNDATP